MPTDKNKPKGHTRVTKFSVIKGEKFNITFKRENKVNPNPNTLREGNKTELRKIYR